MQDRFWQMARQVIEKSDVVLHILDARWGTMTKSDEVVRLCDKLGKPIVYVFNKCDLIPSYRAYTLHRRLQPSVLFSSTKFYGTKHLRSAIGMHSPKKDKDIYVGVVGYPNTGKSSVINALKGRGSAPASSRAGTTKGVQHVRISKTVMLIDSPGVLPLSDLPPARAALLDSKNVDHLKDPVGVACELITVLSDEQPPEWFKDTFGVSYTEHDDPEEWLDSVARFRNRVIKGGLPDTKTIARQILLQWQGGKLNTRGEIHATEP